MPGSLTAHGTTRPVEVRVTRASVDGGTVRFRVTADVDRMDFGVTRQRFRTGHIMHLTINAVSVPVSSAPPEPPELFTS